MVHTHNAALTHIHQQDQHHALQTTHQHQHSLVPIARHTKGQACIAEVLQVSQAAAPTVAPSVTSNATTLHSTLANVSTDTSCSVSLQEETLLCEALPGYLADMSHCTAPPLSSTWHLAG